MEEQDPSAHVGMSKGKLLYFSPDWLMIAVTLGSSVAALAARDARGESS